MGISFGGLASGLDTERIVTSLMGIERQPLTRLSTRKAAVDSASAIINTISTKLTTLKTAAEALSTAKGFASWSATSSDTSVAVAVNGVPEGGNYTLDVTQLAAEQRTHSNTQTSATNALGMTGTLTLTSGAGTPVDVAIDATDSLAAIASKISSSGARVSASILFDGTNYRMVTRGLDTGVANAVTFGQSGFDLGLDVPANTVQSARDAIIKIDGIDIRRPTNEVSDVIPGVNLALSKLATGVSIKTQPDNAALETKISAFITAYNDVVTSSHSATGYGSAKASNAELKGDSVLRTVLGNLSALVTRTIPGTTGLYASLASVGISTTSTGTLKLTSSKLTAAMTADPAAVRRLFVTDANLGASGLMGAMKTTIDGLSGTSESMLQARIDRLGTTSRTLQKSVDSMQMRVDKTEARLRSQFATLEKRMAAYSSQTSALSAYSGRNSGNNS